MPTKREMAERVKVLSAELGIFTPTAGLNHPELARVLGELEAKVEAAKATTPEQPAPAAQQPPAVPTAPAAPFPMAGRYRIGKAALTSPRGVLGPGTWLRPGDVTAAALEPLLKAKLVIDTAALPSAGQSTSAQQVNSDGTAGSGGG